MHLITILDLEDPPARQLGYSLTQTLFRVSAAVVSLEGQAQEIFVQHLEKCRFALSNSIERQGFAA
jgi:hypothetical protein